MRASASTKITLSYMSKRLTIVVLDDLGAQASHLAAGTRYMASTGLCAVPEPIAHGVNSDFSARADDRR